MNHRFPFFTICLTLLCIFGGSNLKANATERTPEDTPTTDDPTESLEYWTSETILTANPRLVRLMDSLYQYTRKEIYQNGVEGDRKWMQRFRKQLCNYYKETRQPDNISELDMADSVIAEANALWALDNDLSTMGMIISNDIERTRLIFKQFNEFERLNSICSTEAGREMLLAEFTEWGKLESLFFNIYSNCVELEYWGGSIRGPISTSGALEIMEAYIGLYKKEYSIISGDETQWDDYGTFLVPAQNLLISCCKQALNDSTQDDPDAREVYNETKSMIDELPEQIDAWCKARRQWGDEMPIDWGRPNYQNNTSEVLIKLAHIISTI